MTQVKTVEEKAAFCSICGTLAICCVKNEKYYCVDCLKEKVDMDD